MRRTIYLTVFLLLASVFTQAAFKEMQGAGGLTYGIFECTDITDSGDYVLTNDISGAQATDACIIITASNVNLDCKGFKVSGLRDGTGIRVKGNDNKITNCVSEKNLYGVGYGFSVIGGNNSFTGNTANNNFAGFGVFGSGNTFTGNTVNDNNNEGFYITGSGNTFTGNTVNNNIRNGFMVDSSGNTFTGNTVNNNIEGGFTVGDSGNTFVGNVIQGNTRGIYYLWGKNVFEGNDISGNGGDNKIGEGNIVIRQDAAQVKPTFKNNKVSDGCGLWQASTNAQITLEGNNFCDSGTRTCADGYKISCVGGGVVDGGRNVFFSGALSPSCGQLSGGNGCISKGINRVAAAPGDGQQQPNYGDAWLPVFALLGVLALGGFMWWHSKKK